MLLVLFLLPIAVLLLWGISRRYQPRGFLSRLMRCWTLGTVLLLAWNLLPLPHLSYNPLSSLLTGALGVSGLPLTLCLNLMQ